jgi:hypothetical protein
MLYCLLRLALIGKDNANIVVRLGVKGVHLQNIDKGSQRLVVAPLLKQDYPQIVYRVRPRRLTAGGGAVFVGCLVQPRCCLQRRTIIKMQGRVVPVQRQTLAEHLQGLVVLPLLLVNSPQVVVRRNVVGLKLDNPGVGHCRFFQVTLLLVNVANIVVKLRLCRVGVYSLS